jgi:chromosome segregation ATPase
MVEDPVKEAQRKAEELEQELMADLEQYKEEMQRQIGVLDQDVQFTRPRLNTLIDETKQLGEDLTAVKRRIATLEGQFQMEYGDKLNKIEKKVKDPAEKARKVEELRGKFFTKAGAAGLTGDLATLEEAMAPKARERESVETWMKGAEGKLAELKQELRGREEEVMKELETATSQMMFDARKKARDQPKAPPAPPPSAPPPPPPKKVAQIPASQEHVAGMRGEDIIMKGQVLHWFGRTQYIPHPL